MRPDVDALLNGAFEAMVTRIIGNPSATYAQGSLGIIGMMMLFSAQEYERGADQRAGENKALRALFAKASGAVSDKALAARLADLSRTSDASLRISDLNAANDALLRGLIDLQTWAEGDASETARALLVETWDFLSASAEARALQLPSMG